MSYEDSRRIRARAQTVWPLLVDVQRWPTWTPSMREVTALQPGPLMVGHQVRVRQPRLPLAIYTVDALDPARSFSWTATTTGVTTRAVHEVEPTEDGCRLRLAVGWAGPLAGPVSLAYGRLTRTFLRNEVEGLTALAERQAA